MNIEYILYVSVNSDLASMNPGKAQAHSGHAASQCASYLIRSGEGVFELWDTQGLGFGTQINLAPAPGLNYYSAQSKIMDVYQQSAQFSETYGIVVDPTYPFIVSDEIFPYLDANKLTSVPKYNEAARSYVCTRNEQTAIWFLVAKDSEVYRAIKENYILHP